MDYVISLKSAADGINFTLPQLPQELFAVNIIENKDVDISSNLEQVFPFSDSEVYEGTTILNGSKLISGPDVKEVYLIELPSHNRFFEPGDTIGIIPHNSDEELKALFKHLNISALMHMKCKIICKDEKVKLKTRPVFLDKVLTLYIIFQNYIDIQCIPKKSLIRVLAEYTKDETEKQILEKLCSKESAQTYEEEILIGQKSFLELILNFSTCQPPIARLLDNLPPLSPRTYSIASSYLASPDRFKIIFSVAESRNEIKKTGLCTGMLKSIVDNKHEHIGIQMFFRKSNGFKLPDNDVYPLILIGCGTGIAPFLGFLEQRKIQGLSGTIWLFYGCRYKSKDFILQEEVEDYLKCGALTKLLVSYSREPEKGIKYVQDNIKAFGKEVCDLVCDRNAIVYVCSDAKGMRNDVLNSFIEILQRHRGLNINDANSFMKHLQKEKRYLQDIWL